MTDTSQTSKAMGGLKVGSLLTIYMMICGNVTPVVVGELRKDFPILTEATWFQIVAFLEGAVPATIIAFREIGVVGLIVRAIKSYKDARKQIEDAANQP